MPKIVVGLVCISAVVLIATLITNKSLANKAIVLDQVRSTNTFWKSFWTPLTLKQGSLENSKNIRREFSQDVKDPLRRFFGLQHFPGTSLKNHDRMMQLHQVKHENPFKSFFGLQPFPGTSLKTIGQGRMMQLHEILNSGSSRPDAYQSTMRRRSAAPRDTMMYQVCFAAVANGGHVNSE